MKLSHPFIKREGRSMSEKENNQNLNNEAVGDQKDENNNLGGGLISELDSKLADFLGSAVVNDIESSLDNLINEQNNPIESLDTKLDSFLAGKYSFEDATGYKKNTQKESQQQNEPTTSTKDFDTEKLRKIQIEKDLLAIKNLIKPSGSTEQKAEPVIESKSDHQVEKKFKDKEIDDALAALKAKTSGLKTVQQKETRAEAPDKQITDTDRDKSLQEFLKKMDKS